MKRAPRFSKFWPKLIAMAAFLEKSEKRVRVENTHTNCRPYGEKNREHIGPVHCLAQFKKKDYFI